jgi:hypothetical protein
MVNHSWSVAITKPKAILLKPSVKTHKKEQAGRDFFRAAAKLANHNWDEEFLGPQILTDNITASHLLDESFQERVELFSYQESKDIKPGDFSKALSQKKKLDHESAISFHQKLQSLSTEKSRWPLMILLTQSSSWFLADHARIFCSLRLKKKSLQIKNGADPKIRYFHALIQDTKKKKNIDILYWLQFDGPNPIDGNFITGFKIPKILLAPTELLSHLKLAPDLAPSASSMLIKTLKQFS